MFQWKHETVIKLRIKKIQLLIETIVEVDKVVILLIKFKDNLEPKM